MSATTPAPTLAEIARRVQAPPSRWGGLRAVESTALARGLTPAKIAGYLRAADDGDPARLAELLHEIEDRDTHLVGVLGTRKRAVANLKWHLEPAGDSVEARAIVASATAAMRRVDALETALVDLLDAVSKGYAAAEIDWRARGAAGRLEPCRLDYRPQQWLRPAPDDPRAWRVLDASDPVYGVPLWPNKWVVHVAQAKSGWPVQSGLGRALVWWYLFKNYAIKDWVSYGEKFGAPLRLGKYPSTATPTDITSLAEALEQLGVDAWAAIPSDMSVELVGDNAATRGPDVFERLLLFANREISKCVLGQTLTTEEGANGSLALGAVHNSVRADIRDTDALQLARTLTGDLVRPYVLFNHGPLAAESLCPRWVFETEPPADKSAEADVQTKRGAVFKIALELGIAVSAAQVREELGIREVEPGEPVLRLPAAPPSTGLPALARDRVVAGCGHHHGELALGVGKTSVSPVPALDAAMSSYRERVGLAWREMVVELAREIGTQPSPGEARAAVPRVLERLDLAPYADPLAEAMLHAQALGLLQARAADSREVADAPGGSPFDAQRWAEPLGVTEADWASRVVDARVKAADAIRYALLASARDLVEGIERQARERGDELADEARRAEYAEERRAELEADPRRSVAVVEGATTSAWGDGRWEGVGADKRRVFLRYNTMQDARVRPAHAAMQGRVYPADHPIWKVWRPPNGFGCRCWLTAHTAAEVEAAGWDVLDSYPSLESGPAVPDKGWTGKDRGEEQRDLSAFPEDWRAAVGQREAEYRVAIQKWQDKGGRR